MLKFRIESDSSDRILPGLDHDTVLRSFDPNFIVCNRSTFDNEVYYESDLGKQVSVVQLSS